MVKTSSGLHEYQGLTYRSILLGIGSILVHPSIPCVGMLGTTRYVPYQQLVGTPIRIGNANHDEYITNILGSRPNTVSN